jgi:hypothetical protein
MFLLANGVIFMGLGLMMLIDPETVINTMLTIIGSIISLLGVILLFFSYKVYQLNKTVDYEELSLIKDKAIILNLGRGGIVNEDAIAKIIDERELYFGLDVLEKEPMKKDHPLLKIKNKDNLYITPHIAWTSIEARKKLIEGVIQNIKKTL